MNSEPIILRLDERNLAHVLTALAMAGIADAIEDADPASRCWWTEDGFKLLLPQSETELFAQAHKFAKSIRWVAGIGRTEKGDIKASPHHGLFTAEGRRRGNPLLSYHDQGVTSSVFKTFSGQQSPSAPLQRQQNALKPINETSDWLFQPGHGVASWKFDCRVASHAYDLGFGSNEDQSGDRDPFYPAIELMSIAGAAFFSGSPAWLVDAGTLNYCIWEQPLALSLASLAAMIIPPRPPQRSTTGAKLPSVKNRPNSLLDGIAGRYYRIATRGNAYGKGAAYRHFPEASLATKPTNY